MFATLLRLVVNPARPTGAVDCTVMPWPIQMTGRGVSMLTSYYVSKGGEVAQQVVQLDK